MKNLKHYFTSPAGSDNEVLNGNNEIISRKRKIKSESNSLECTSSTPVGTKKKKKKKNFTEESEQDKSPEINPPKLQKKRKKTIDKASLKKTRVTKLVENVSIPQKTEEYNEKLFNNHLKKSADSSKENSMNSSPECDEKSFEISNNLHNYFGKIDKPPDIRLKSNILKVEAIVHYPPSEGKTKPPKRLKTRLRRRKSLDLGPEYDIITSEEDNSSLQNSLNEISADVTVTLEHESNTEGIVTSSESLTETSEITDTITAKFQSDPRKHSTPVPVRVKHDGTLNSFLKVHNSMMEHSLQEVSEERKLAKQQFLNSGMPDNMRKVMNKQKDILLIEAAPFPKQQHVTQADTLSVMWNLKVIKLKLKLPQPDVINIPQWSHVIRQKSETESLGVEGAEPNSLDRKKIIKALSKEIPEYPIKKWYAELFKMKAGSENEMWTEKYKPKSSLHLIGNSKNVEKLKSWLQKLNTNLKKENVTYCSDDEFLKSEDELVTDIRNTALLQGPAGIGKTAAIYGLAEEIGYQILEINSSCNRMGKKILYEFSEALQSHKVEANVLNFTGTKKNKVDDSKKSLILIEDIDVTFLDYDEGFLSTIGTLAATSKRPIIFTVNNFNPKYLAKIIPFLQFKLDFEPLHQNVLCSWIRTLAAVEGIVLDKPKADKLIEWANGDIRKLLLQLQFSLIKDPKMIYSEHQIETNNVWERMSENRFNTREQAKNTAHLCNLLVVCDLLNGGLNCQLSSDDPAKKPWHSTLKYSSELNQPNESTDHPTRDMLADTIQILKEKATSFRHQYQTLRYEKSLVIPSIEREVLSFTSVLSHSSVATDYLPVLRTIARCENKRLAEHTKRNNRYFSYLQSIGITENTIKISNILSETLSTVV